MREVTSRVKGKISKLPPYKFVIFCDGWRAMKTHYLCVFAVFSSLFPSRATFRSSKFLLFCSPFEDEKRLNADSHKIFLEFFFLLFSTSVDNIRFLNEDNYNTNKPSAHLSEKLLHCCYIHCFKFAVQDVLKQYEVAIDFFYGIFARHCTLTSAAQLRKFTSFHPILVNKARWSSAYSILKRYIMLRPFLNKNDSEKVTCFFSVQNRTVTFLMF